MNKSKKIKTLQKRDEKILILINIGWSFEKIGNKFSISKQRVQQIAKNNNLYVHQETKKIKANIVEQIKKEVELGFSFDYIRNKDREVSWGLIVREYFKLEGIYLSVKMREERNRLIVDKYSSGETAREVIESDDLVLNSPIKFSKVRDVYRISSDLGFRKFPKIGIRSKGGSFECDKIMSSIVRMRDDSKMTFKDIANSLNKKGMLTISGLKFSGANVNKKYHKNIKI